MSKLIPPFTGTILTYLPNTVMVFGAELKSNIIIYYMEMPGIEPRIVNCKLTALPFKLHPLHLKSIPKDDLNIYYNIRSIMLYH